MSEDFAVPLVLGSEPRVLTRCRHATQNAWPTPLRWDAVSRIGPPSR